MSLPVPYQGHLGPLIWRGRRDPKDPGRGLPPHGSHASVLCGWKYHQRSQLSHVSITSAIDSFLWRIQPLFFSRICVLIVVQSLSRVQLFTTLWTAACQASLSFTISRSLLKIVSIESVIPSNHVILYRPLLPSTFPSVRIFSNESALHIRWPKYWSFSFSICPSNEDAQDHFPFGLTGLISLLSKRLSTVFFSSSLKASILRCSAFFMVQLSHSYVTTGKTIALTRQTFVSKEMSLLFNTLSRFVTTFLPRNKRLLISQLP